ncbi:MAG: hypothetical protein U5N86_11200 [Planctomycetota bacterium]|nr:hypothetical protein [Planctomycetota bacterium]
MFIFNKLLTIAAIFLGIYTLVACPPKIDPVTMRVSEKAERPGGSK